MSNASLISRPALSELGRFVVGFDQMFDMLHNMDNWVQSTSAVKNGYPPYNIIKRDDDHYAIEMAVAGFGESDLSITLANNTITVTGNAETQDSTVEYLYRGLSHRKFHREFKLGPYITVTGAAVVNGVLTIEVERQLPDEMRPRQVEIKFNN